MIGQKGTSFREQAGQMTDSVPVNLKQTEYVSTL